MPQAQPLLDGLWVLTFEQFGASHYGSMLLADLDAEAIKVGNPAGGGCASRQKRGARLARTPVQTLRTRDGWIFVACMIDKFWDILIEGLEHPDLGQAPRGATSAARLANRDALTDIVDTALSRAPSAQWLDLFAGRIPIAPVSDMATALNNPFVAETDMISTVAHPAEPGLRVLATPLRINGARPAQAACHVLGADTEDVLGTTPENAERTGR